MKKNVLRWIDDVRRGIDPEDRVHNEAMVEGQPGPTGSGRPPGPAPACQAVGYCLITAFARVVSGI